MTTNSRALNEIERLQRMWSGDAPADASWLREGLAIEGDFSGIQNYVLKPVPGARGAAKRLRARSFRVANQTAQIARDVCREVEAASPFYVAGGRFLINAPRAAGWEDRVQRIQASLDKELYEQFGGEVAFHLAAAEYRDGRIPVQELFEAHRVRRSRPLKHVLMADGEWREEAFFRKAGAGWGKCPACLRTAHDFRRTGEEEQEICADCASDMETGARLAQWRFDRGKEPVLRRDELVNHFPKHGPEPASFEHLAAVAPGKQWLGHLRIDADYAGFAFRELEGDPGRTWGLSRLLHTFFCGRVQELVAGTYQYIYPVYGGGDDLYVIGPWDKTVELARTLSAEFSEIKGPRRLTFSAGLALGKPHQHILTKADEAMKALDEAKRSGRDGISAMGTVTNWQEFRKILRRAGDVLRWMKAGTIPAALEDRPKEEAAPPTPERENFGAGFLQDVLSLSKTQDGLWKARLHYQSSRNVERPDQYCQQWIADLLQGGEEWKRAPAVIRYALLATRGNRG